MNKHKILIITESMFPFTNGWGSCQRVYNYAREFVASGYTVTVFCKNNSQRSDGEEVVNGICVVGFGKRYNIESASVNRPSMKEQLKIIRDKSKIASWTMRQCARICYSEPNVFIGPESHKWAKRAFPLIKELINKSCPDIVIISGPPFGFFGYVPLLKKTGIRIVLDYRDPWNLWYEKWSFSSKVEAKAIRNSDLVVASTQPLAKEFSEKYKKANVHTILNGYDETLWNKVRRTNECPSDQLIISYIGWIMINNNGNYRDPTVFLQAIKKFVKEHNDVRFNFIGVSDNIESIDPELRNTVHFTNSIPVCDSIVEMLNSDVLLVFHTAHDSSGKYIICGKMYDYLRSGKFVLSIGDRADANHQFVEKTGIGTCCRNNIDDILETLENIYDLWKEKKLSILKPMDMDTFSRKSQNKKFTKLLDQLLYPREE